MMIYFEDEDAVKLKVAIMTLMHLPAEPHHLPSDEALRTHSQLLIFSNNPDLLGSELPSA
jgi:hypothetical protein